MKTPTTQRDVSELTARDEFMEQRREFVELLTRAVVESDESDALSIDPLIDVGKGIFEFGRSLFSGQ